MPPPSDPASWASPNERGAACVRPAGPATSASEQSELRRRPLAARDERAVGPQVRPVGAEVGELAAQGRCVLSCCGTGRARLCGPGAAELGPKVQHARYICGGWCCASVSNILSLTVYVRSEKFILRQAERRATPPAPGPLAPAAPRPRARRRAARGARRERKFTAAGTFPGRQRHMQPFMHCTQSGEYKRD